MNQALRVTYVLYNLCLLKRSPEELPYSYTTFLVLAGILVGGMVYGFNSQLDVGIYTIIQAALMSLALFAMGVYIILWFEKKIVRWLKIMIGLLGTQLLLSIFFIPLLLIASSNPSAILTLRLVCDIWILISAAFVLRKGLEIRMVSGLLMVFILKLFASIPIFPILMTAVNEGAK